ncbi:hypothetical protein ABG768_014852 [Culter alburnus]|uniref:Uncharacterized protein n=1 Tax=Culter alburnus TaxID=194366 RepID=A0AAW1Z2J9_CULAL
MVRRGANRTNREILTHDQNQAGVHIQTPAPVTVQMVSSNRIVRDQWILERNRKLDRKLGRENICEIKGKQNQKITKLDKEKLTGEQQETQNTLAENKEKGSTDTAEKSSNKERQVSSKERK